MEINRVRNRHYRKLANFMVSLAKFRIFNFYKIPGVSIQTFKIYSYISKVSNLVQKEKVRLYGGS
jgi:hypothetical protein